MRAGSPAKLRVGYTQRSYEDPRFDKLSGLIGDASLIWTANALTTVKLTAYSTHRRIHDYRRVRHILSRCRPADRPFVPPMAGRHLKFGFGVDTYKGGSVDPTDSTVICGCVVSSPSDTS